MEIRRTSRTRKRPYCSLYFVTHTDRPFQACTEVKDKTGHPGLVSDFSDSTMLNCWLREKEETLFDEAGQGVKVTEDTLAEHFQYCSVLMKSEALVSVWKDEFLLVSDNGGDREQVSGAFCLGTSEITRQGGTGDMEVTDPPSNEGKSHSPVIKTELFLSVSASLPPEKQKAAAEFINWFLNDQTAVRNIGTERGIPASPAARSLLREDGRISPGARNLLQFYETKETEKRVYESTASLDIEMVNQVYSDVMKRLSRGERTPQEAAKEFLHQIAE